MPEDRPEGSSPVDEYVATLKSKIPTMEHAAVDSRAEELLNDPTADEDYVISILDEAVTFCSEQGDDLFGSVATSLSRGLVG